jgi:hypothetical protein
VDRGFDPNAADPLRGLTAHAYGGDAPVDLLGVQAAAARTRPWSRGALRALFTAWLAIASSYRSEAHVGAADDGTVRSEGDES